MDNVIGPRLELANMISKIDMDKVIGPRLELANMISKIDMDKVIGPRLELANMIYKIDMDKVIGPRLELANMISKIDMDKVIGPRLNVAKISRAFDDQVVMSVMRGIRPESLSRVAAAAAAASSTIDVRRLEDSSIEFNVDDETALELPDRLIDLGLEGLDEAPDEVARKIEELLEEPASASGIRVPVAIGVAIVLGSFAFVAAIHNSLVAAQSPEAERFVASFFDHMNFYVAVAFLILALRDRG